MNILILVMTMLMLLSIMTYARIESYRDFAVLKREFKRYMEKVERNEINHIAERWYEKTRGSQKASAERTVVNATARIPFAYFTDKNFREAHKGEFPVVVETLKRLIQLLYSEAPFYKELEQTHPGFVDAMLMAITVSADNLTVDGKSKLTTITDIANLNLGDPLLNDAFLKMLKGARYHEVTLATTTDAVEDEEEETSEDLRKAKEYHSPQGYFSLYDFITLDKKPKIRIYLAPYIVLLAIFGDPAIAQDIISKRYALYQQVYTKKLEPAAATAEFKREFDFKYGSGMEQILDFTVTKTNPNRYL